MKLQALRPLKAVVARKLLYGQLKYFLPWSVVLAQTVVIMVLLWGWSEIANNKHTMCKCAPACPGEGIQLNSFGQLSSQQLKEILETEDDETDLELVGELPVQVPKDQPRVFYNRVPKCGSSTLMDLITELSKANNFTFARAKEFMRFWIEDSWQRQFAGRVRKLEKPVLYERHLHFMDFSQFGMNQPVYMNLVRDPLERLVSWYYFRRYQSGHRRHLETAKTIRTYDECVLGNFSECVEPMGDDPEEGFFKIVPFFCGQEEFCRQPSEESLIHAIRNVKRSYAVVGIMEEYPKFILALEHVLPKYFKGATKLFKVLEPEWRKRHKTTYKLPINLETSRVMHEKLKHEYQFYYFLRQRFYHLVASIEELKMKAAEKNPS